MHQELFFLEPLCKQAFKYSSPDTRLRQIFAQHGHPLGAQVTFVAKNSRAWRVLDGKKRYLVKDVGDRLVVVQEKQPRFCRLVEFVLYGTRSKFNELRWQLYRRGQLQAWALKKRWVDKPSKLIVNIGAGDWYVRDWKVLEYQGEWYRFAPSFIDFEHDLTSNRPFPFADDSVHLFYSEHVFEHMKDESCEHIFREARRCLEKGGGFRIVVPDADLIYDRLLKRDVSFFKSWMDRDNSSLAEAFRTLVGQARSQLDEVDFEGRLSTLPKEEFLNWCKKGLEYDLKRTGEHINWFNFEKLAQMLGEAGFSHVRRCGAQQSGYAEARGPRFDTRPGYSLHVECVRE